MQHTEHVVYILGAGFSAPLGLPVVSNFILKAKDMFAKWPEQHQHFSQVFREIERMATIKNYFSSDLFNIEEVLSIIEMESQLKGSKMDAKFVDFIVDVIGQYTPKLPHLSREVAWDTDRAEFLFGHSDSVWQPYGAFISALLGVAYQGTVTQGSRDLLLKELSPPPGLIDQKYSVVTLNYDRVLENVAAHFANSAAFSTSFVNPSEEHRDGTVLAKLHGCAYERNIIPPTWSKAVSPSILAQWKEAHRALSTANHIRVIGYSLPEADSYVKYLLKSALRHVPHLKSFDVITLDSDGETRKRYENFVDFKYMRFASRDSKEYLSSVASFEQDAAIQGARFARISQTKHEDFMNGTIQSSPAKVQKFPIR